MKRENWKKTYNLKKANNPIMMKKNECISYKFNFLMTFCHLLCDCETCETIFERNFTFNFNSRAFLPFPLFLKASWIIFEFFVGFDAARMFYSRYFTLDETESILICRWVFHKKKPDASLLWNLHLRFWRFLRLCEGERKMFSAGIVKGMPDMVLHNILC